MTGCAERIHLPIAWMAPYYPARCLPHLHSGQAGELLGSLFGISQWGATQPQLRQRLQRPGYVEQRRGGKPNLLLHGTSGGRAAREHVVR